MKRGFCGALLVIFLLVSLGSAFADPSLTIQDTAVKTGAWAEAYGQILRDRSAEIQTYQEYVANVSYGGKSHPIGLTDLTGDGVPELLFVDHVHDTEYGFELGRLWIYTADARGVHCALTLTPEIDDLLYSTLYLGPDGLLTMHMNDTEMGWTFQFRMDPAGYYQAETTLISQEDFSGEGPDQYFQNGKEISAKAYTKTLKEIQGAQGTKIGTFMEEDDFSGFTYTLEEALNTLGSAEIPEIQHPETENGGEQGSEVSGKWFPELFFFEGTFEAGQKFAVYSAPSARSWRGANGKAAITSGSEIFVAGMADDWILILYELDSGVIRVGYINPEKISGSYTSGSALSFSETPMKLVKSTVMTDDPIRQKTTISKLKKGATVTCLAEYRGWIYVEAKVSGKTARGFIAPSSLGLE